LFLHRGALAAVLGATTLLVGCRQDMHNQPRYKPLAATDFFGDGRSARPTIEDTVARGQLQVDSARFTGKENGKDINYFPIEITHDDLVRGQERFNIFCSPCHGRLGDGNGMIVSRGLRQPPSYHDARLRNSPVGHFFDVMTNGYGAMYSYASRVPVDDRWRIAAYIRALQYSQDTAGGLGNGSTGPATSPAKAPTAPAGKGGQ
jgi:cytochrome c553